MKRIYEKNELAFALLWIGVYVVLMSLADNFSSLVGVEKAFTAPISVFLTLFLWVWIKKMNLSEKYGLIKGNFPQKAYLWFLPLAFIVSVNFWAGATLRYTLLESVLYVISMLCVGFLEEIIFRGFLFQVLRKDSLTVAFIVGSLTFGFGHIINLLSGAEIVETLLQIAYATAAGFLFSVIFYKSGSLLPCIITHSAINATSAFSGKATPILEVITAIALTVVSVVYAVWILRFSDTKKE